MFIRRVYRGSSWDWNSSYEESFREKRHFCLWPRM